MGIHHLCTVSSTVQKLKCFIWERLWHFGRPESHELFIFLYFYLQITTYISYDLRITKVIFQDHGALPFNHCINVLWWFCSNYILFPKIFITICLVSNKLFCSISQTSCGNHGEVMLPHTGCQWNWSPAQYHHSVHDGVAADFRLAFLSDGE